MRTVRVLVSAMSHVPMWSVWRDSGIAHRLSEPENIADLQSGWAQLPVAQPYPRPLATWSVYRLAWPTTRGETHRPVGALEPEPAAPNRRLRFIDGRYGGPARNPAVTPLV